MKKILWPVLFSLVAAIGRAEAPYHFIKEIPIGGGGGWDYLTVDPAAHRLYVSHATHIVVVDLNTDKIAGEIADTPGVHGIAIADDLGLGVTSNGRENKAGIVDLKTLRTLSKVDTAAGPDAMLYDPGQKEAWLFCGRAEAATVIDVKAARVVATVPLGGRPEFAAVDPEAGRIYDNLENKDQVAMIDTRTHQVLRRWPIAPGESASGMAIDAAHHRLFLGCHNRRLVMMDATDGKVLATAPIGFGVDACAIDPGTQLAFASCGEGSTTIAKEESPDKLTVVQVLKTERGARTMALDPTTHKIYLATAQFGPPPEPANGQRRRRPQPAPGSFKVLEYGMEK
ncbi:MAG: YncE family protein [Verrucomicrobiota bacterium]|nr:YncE family protein [Verrucomicrobiota bacterium]